VCPLSQEPFKDPVICDDGQTYERALVEAWFTKEGAKSPLTSEPVESTELMPNTILINKMKAWRDAQAAPAKTPAKTT